MGRGLDCTSVPFAAPLSSVFECCSGTLMLKWDFVVYAHSDVVLGYSEFFLFFLPPHFPIK